MIADAFRQGLVSGDFGALVDLYEADAVFDGHVPQWRYQVQGPDAIAAELAKWFPGPGTLPFWEVLGTDAGPLVRFERHFDEAGEEKSVRQAHLFRERDGRIVDHVGHCIGVLGPHQRAEMAEQAPLVRP